ncbi:hypothetical protein ACIGXM_23870 [Kitasatospora sp. NPDC052896]|uniref:hypothetical protein n=1 Tax=Kitasatospora sp. NPDC052896 TaxID=3364061 RepID=UPI0037CC096C
MLSGDRETATRLRLAAAVAEIEGLHAALLHATDPARRIRLLTRLSEAGHRLGELASPTGAAVPPQSRRAPARQRRRAAILRGARWLTRLTRSPDHP